MCIRDSKLPSVDGYCAVKKPSGFIMKHRSCQCDTSTVAEPHLLCKRLCNEDQDCKGYSYWPGRKTCKYYTETHGCATTPVTCTPIGFNTAGNIGKIFTQPESDQKGCYIKEKRKNKHQTSYKNQTILRY